MPEVTGLTALRNNIRLLCHGHRQIARKETEKKKNRGEPPTTMDWKRGIKDNV